MRRSALFLIGAALVLCTAACGGGAGSAETFDAGGIGVTFKYPSEFAPIKNISFAQSAGAEPAARAGVSVDSVNAIIVSRYDLRLAITSSNLARFKGEVDNVISQLAGKQVYGRNVEFGGLPGYEYSISVTKPPNGLSRLLVLFDGATEYLINCQSTPDKRDTVEAACQMALDTLDRK
jgi:hypothetical protein